MAFDAAAGRYSVYLGLASDLRRKRSNPILPTSCRRHEILAHDLEEDRITPDLTNALTEA